MMIRTWILSISTLIISSLILPNIVLAEPVINISSSQSSVTAGDEITVSITINQFETSTSYSLKSLGGVDLYEVQTYNNSASSWLNWNDEWSQMPTVTSPATIETQFQTTLKARFKPDTTGGTKDLKVRIRKTGIETNYDSNAINFSVSAKPSLTPTPTATPTITPTPTPTPNPKASVSPTLKPTKSPTPKPSVTPTPQVLGEEKSLSSPIPFGATESPNPLVQSDTDTSGSYIPPVAVLFIFAGCVLVGISTFSFFKFRRNSYNDLDENSILRPHD